MSRLLYLLAIILVMGWLLGIFIFHLGGIIHILLAIAVMAILFRVIRGRDVI